MKNKRVVLDVDSVLLDYEAAFIQKYNLSKPESPNGLGSLLHDSKYTEKDIFDMIVGLNTSFDFSRMKAVRGARDAVMMLKSYGLDLVTVSSCGDNIITEEYRNDNLDHEFGVDAFTKKHTLPLCADKTATITALGGDILVDDRIFHCKNMVASGKKAIMFDSGYLPDEVAEAKELGIPVYDNWWDVMTRLEIEYAVV